jgi:hypothetical protein
MASHDPWELREEPCEGCGAPAQRNDVVVWALCDDCVEALRHPPPGAPCAACGEDATVQLGFMFWACADCAPAARRWRTDWSPLFTKVAVFGPCRRCARETPNESGVCDVCRPPDDSDSAG